MGLWAMLTGSSSSSAPAPRNATQEIGGGTIVTSAADLEEVLRGGNASASGASVTASSAMRVAAVFACVRIISGAIANLPLDIKRRVDEKTRVDASDSPLWRLLRRRPNRWQTPAQFKRMMQAHVLLRGNAYALIVGKPGAATELLPLDPDRMTLVQGDDLALRYTYQTKAGRQASFKQSEILHLVGLTLDGVHGISVIAYARETIGLALSMENHGAKMFKNGARVSGVLSHPDKLGKEGRENLQASLEAYRSSGEAEGRELVLEEGMKYERLALTAEDAQWLESRKFSRTDIAMFFGVPPHMIGDTEKATSWGSGIEQQSIGFETYTLADHLTMWEETIARDLIVDERSEYYARFNRAAIVRGDIKTRWDAYTKAMQWGVMSPNEIRALEDLNPRADGDIYYPPPNMTAAKTDEASNDDPQAT